MWICYFLGLLSIFNVDGVVVTCAKDGECSGNQIWDERGSSLLQGWKSNFKTALKSRFLHSDSQECNEYMVEAARDLGDFAAGTALTGGAATVADMAASAISAFHAVEDAGKMAKMGSKLALAGGSVGLIFAFAGEYFIPDPDEKRITNLQNGMLCLHQALYELEEEVKNLAADVNVNNAKVAALSELPMKQVYGDLKLQAESHRTCAKLMGCVADAELYTHSWGRGEHAKQTRACEVHMNGRQPANCNADVFQKKFHQTNDYHFVVNEAMHIWAQSAVVAFRDAGLGNPARYTPARDVLSEYVLVLNGFTSAWSALEEWASAICRPFGNNQHSCTDAEKNDVADGLAGFKRGYVDVVTGYAKTLADKLNSETSIGLSNSDVRKTKTTTSYCRIGFIAHKEKTSGPCGWRKSCTYKYKYEYPLVCDYDALKRQCDSKPCEITIPPSGVYGATYTSCSSVDARTICCRSCHPRARRCKERCDLCDCGYLNQQHSTLTYEELYNPLKDVLVGLNAEVSLLSERTIRQPYYTIAPGRDAQIGKTYHDAGNSLSQIGKTYLDAGNSLSPSTKLLRPDGGSVVLKEMKRGDQVFMHTAKDIAADETVVPGSFHEAAMLGWAARSTKTAHFVHFRTVAGREVAVSLNHYLWVKSTNKMEIAEEVKAGDSLPYRTQEGTVEWDAIDEIGIFEEEGELDPTLFDGEHQGDMVVTADGLIVPIYAKLGEFRGFDAHEAHHLFFDMIRDLMPHKDDYGCLFQETPGGMLLAEIIREVLTQLTKDDYVDEDKFDLKWLSKKMAIAAPRTRKLQALLARCPKFAESEYGIDISKLPFYSVMKDVTGGAE